MGNLTKNISRSEVACHCGCGFDTMDFETLLTVQNCCNHFAQKMGLPYVVLTVTSGARCKKHNKVVGGGVKSQHLYGRAIDFTILGVPPEVVYAYLNTKFLGQYGLGRYNSFTHIDTRTDGGARW